MRVGTNQYIQLRSLYMRPTCRGRFYSSHCCKHCLCLSEVLGGEHALGAAQDGVLGRVVRMLFGWDLQHGRDRLHVGIDGVTDHLSDELVNQDNADVVTCQEAPGWRKTEVKIEFGTEPRNTKPYFI